jgi:eukaryotic-like serine/threonine-protein kinase
VGFSVENVCGFLIRSQLMTPDVMRAMYQRWQSAAGADAAQLGAFLKWLVETGYVTDYQANLLGQGHADNFFLNQYKILERLGRGRMAGVFKAVHNLGQVVAIKVLPPSRAKLPQILARFQREAQLAMRLKHPNVVRSFQVGEQGGVHYLVMEHLEGETLEELLRRRRTLEPAEACRLAHQTLLGLAHIHEQGMVHRDIKPANIFLEETRDEGRGAKESTPGGSFRAPHPSPLVPRVKILDIGLAREFFEETLPSAAGQDGPVELTAEGVLLGTPDYLAPEQARDPRRSDIRADIYSVGCVLYHMLTGKPPFPDRNLFNQIVRHATEPPRPLRTFNPAIPEGLEQIVGWMIAKQPDQRYPTPDRAAKALEMFLLVGAEPDNPEEPPQMRRYLTWLESECQTQPPAPIAVVKPPSSAEVPAKPRSSPAVPLAPPVAPAVAPPVAPAVAPPARPVAIAATPAAIDVELVPLQELPGSGPLIAPPIGPIARSNKKALLIGIIVGAVVLSCGCAGLGAWAVSKLFG